MFIELKVYKRFFRECISKEKDSYLIDYTRAYQILIDMGVDIPLTYVEYKKFNKFLDVNEWQPTINALPLLKEIHFKLFNFYVFDTLNRGFRSLSHGEKHAIAHFINIYEKVYFSKKQNFIIILDEVDISLHPVWQKKYISKLTFLFSNINKSLHIILTSHSPFLLSDIPKQNIIFLDKDEKGNCKVVDGLKEKKQTFGANIHTLLSDSFFMEDGLMGEFAKGKIDGVIKLLNKDKLNEEEIKHCEQIISIIGEPIVKNQLQRMLDSKRLKKVDEIDAIKKSMEAMQKRLDELEK
ncbi:MAG: Unknown protein [uncultured Sulfurovum sp.]|uniref:ATPase AAA-type core domain-containing protein n=1 Tax=uncultured Sulfurovum sp. TaxID=269237 RepID=A0A6S6S8I1_9BACT|nr:MAG: Unknown protein [uncultured Sulfurovum sp.]